MRVPFESSDCEANNNDGATECFMKFQSKVCLVDVIILLIGYLCDLTKKYPPK